jgi:hypothetical protein
MTTDIRLGMPFDDYLAVPAVSQSSLKKHRISMAHVQAAMTTDMEPTDAMKFGTALHMGLLEPQRTLESLAVWDGKARRGKDWQEFQAQNSGKTILTRTMYDKWSGAMEATVSDPHINAVRELMRHTEASGFTTFPGSVPSHPGHLFKGRADALADDYVIDVKTVNTQTFQRVAQRGFDEWMWVIRNMGYDFQAGAYTHLFDRKGFVFLFIESDAPYSTASVVLDPTVVTEAQVEFLNAMEKYVLCADTGIWPGPFDEVMATPMPAPQAVTLDGVTI